MNLNIAQQYIDEINQDFEWSMELINLTGTTDRDKVEFINNATILSICIKFEAFTADLYQSIYPNRKIAYNHPWANTRQFAKKLDIDISEEYKAAHDAWGYYNALKHVNRQSRIAEAKLSKEYNIKSSWEALQFVHNALLNLLGRFRV